MSDYNYDSVLDLMCGQNHDPALRKFARQCLEFRQPTIDQLKAQVAQLQTAVQLLETGKYGRNELHSKLAYHESALKEAKWLVDNAPVATIHKEWRERANTFVATINKALGETEGK